MKYLEITTANTLQIVSTSDLKEHLRITFNNDDNYIVALESAAVKTVENFCNIFLLETELTQYGFDINDLNILFKSEILTGNTPVLSVYSNGGWVAQSGVEFITESKPPRMYLNNSTISTADSDISQKYKVVYKVGYSSISNIPQPLIQAIKIMVADMYENRQSVVIGKAVSEVPKTAEYLMQQYKIQTL
jgi:uncharacterized phiE125 gp8 family phage protein|tara:strand:+ start:121 stop:690 length:570 start_codon:yes stop_codon:yes gene_type:complete